MTREDLVEKMRRAYDGSWLRGGPYESHTAHRDSWNAAFTALESALPGLSDVVEGRAVIVPREPTQAMLDASWRSTGDVCDDERMRVMLMSGPMSHKVKMLRRWRAMLSAAPTKE